MNCPICDQKPMNCDCTAAERQQYGEIEELRAEVARLRLTDLEREAVRAAIELEEYRGATSWASALRGILERLGDKR